MLILCVCCAEDQDHEPFFSFTRDQDHEPCFLLFTCDSLLGMAIRPKLDRHPPKISAIGRVKSRFYGYGLGSG